MYIFIYIIIYYIIICIIYNTLHVYYVFIYVIILYMLNVTQVGKKFGHINVLVNLLSSRK